MPKERCPIKAEAELSTWPGHYRCVMKGCNVNQRLFRGAQMKIPIVEMMANCRSEAHAHLKYSDCRPLPASYMSEYSVLGLVVDELDQAIRTLSGNRLYVTGQVFGAELDIGDSARVPEIVEMLLGAGIYCSTGDVDRMRRRPQTKRGKAKYKLRSRTVEPVFGQIKAAMGIYGFMRRGIDAV
jgi:hypothetical protein